MDLPAACPCGSRERYEVCCGPLHGGTPAPTAARLMRARYSAYALGRLDYLVRTWDPATRPADLTLEPGLVWRRLQIVDTARGGAADSEGVVEFRASYRTADAFGVLHERSRFTRRSGEWVYVDGEILGD